MAGVPLDLCLLAYPPRWRRTRRAELAALLADLAGDDGRQGPPRVGVREAAGLLVGGLRTRVRTGPSVRERMGYRYLERRLPARHRGWVHDELHSLAGAVGEWAWIFLPLVATPALLGSAVSRMLLPFTILCLLVRRSLFRERRRARYLVPRAGEQPTRWDLHWELRNRRRVGARALLAWLLALGSALTVLSCVVVALAPQRWRAAPCEGACWLVDPAPGGLGTAGALVLVGALVAGAVAAVVVRSRVRARVDHLPDQPARELVAPSRSALAALALVTVLLVALVASELSAAPTLAWPGAVVGLVVLPVLATVTVTLTRSARGRAVAVADLRPMVWGRDPEIDVPQRVAVAWVEETPSRAVAGV